jgi:hypothetical protein
MSSSQKPPFRIATDAAMKQNTRCRAKLGRPVTARRPGSKTSSRRVCTEIVVATSVEPVPTSPLWSLTLLVRVVLPASISSMGTATTGPRTQLNWRDFQFRGTG